MEATTGNTSGSESSSTRYQEQANLKCRSRSGRSGRAKTGRGLFLFALCLVNFTQCPPVPLVTLPAAETPVLETLLDIDNNAIASFGSPGVFQMLPGRRIELRFRAIFPTNIQIGINANRLREVTDTASHPEIDGYYHTEGKVPVPTSDPR